MQVCFPPVARSSGAVDWRTVAIDGGATTTYAGLVDARGLELLLDALAPWLRVLLLGGWDVTEVMLGVADPPDALGVVHPPGSWLCLDLATGTARAMPGLWRDATDHWHRVAAAYAAFVAEGRLPPEYGAPVQVAVLLRLRGLRDPTTGEPLHFDLLPEAAFARLGEVAAGDSYEIVYADPSLPRPTTLGELCAWLAAAVEGDQLQALRALASRWVAVGAGAGLPVGLRGLLDAAAWASPSAGTPPGEALRAAAADLFAGAAALPFDPMAALVAELSQEAAPLTDLLDHWAAPGSASSKAPLAAATAAIADAVALARSRRSDLPDALLANLGALPWLDVLVAFAQAGLVGPPGVGTEVDEWEVEEPVQIGFAPGDPEGTYELWVLPFSQRVLVSRPRPLPDVAFAACFTWEWLPDHESGVATLVLVAAPGIALALPDGEPDGWRLEIYRVQSPSLVGDWGVRIRPETLLADYPALVGGAPEVSPRLQIRYTQTGAVFRMPSKETEQYWELEVEVDPLSGDDRFGFWLHDPPTGVLEALEFHVLTTPDVRVRYTEHGLNALTISDETFWRDGMVFSISDAALTVDTLFPHGRLQEGDFARIPFPGGPFEVDDFRNRPPDAYELKWNVGFGYDVVTFILDVAIGAIPIVGDLVDAIELLQALYTGRDKWGRPLTRWDYVFMGAGVLVPIGSSAFFRKLGQGTMEGLDEAADLVGGSTGAIGDALEGLPPLSRVEFEERLARARAFDSLDPAAKTDLTDWLKRTYGDLGAAVHGERVYLDELARLDGFSVPELDRAYRAWAGGDPDLTIEDFVRAMRRDTSADTVRARLILRALLGDDLTVASRTERYVPMQALRWPMNAARALSGHSARWPDIVAGLRDEDAIRRALELHYDDARIEGVIRVLKTLGDGELHRLDDARLGRLLGNWQGRRDAGKPVPSLQEILQIMADGVVVVDEICAGIDGGVHAGLREDVLRVKGIEEFFYGAITRCGTENGARFEVANLAHELVMLGRVQGVADPWKRLTAQIWVDGKKGPDIGILDAERTTVRLVQCKSFSDAGKVTSFTARSNVVLNQLASDLSRLRKQGFAVDVDGRRLPVDPVLTWRLDWKRVEGGGDLQARAEEFQRQIDQILADPAALAALGMDVDDPPIRVVVELL